MQILDFAIIIPSAAELVGRQLERRARQIFPRGAETERQRWTLEIWGRGKGDHLVAKGLFHGLISVTMNGSWYRCETKWGLSSWPYDAIADFRTAPAD